MRIFRHGDPPMRAADPSSFVGAAETKLLGSSDDAAPTQVYRVEFNDGARTNWHAHSGAQWLLVVEGRIRVQTWGQPPLDVQSGDAVVVAPGEKHWHGAAPGARGIHLAVNIANVKTEWLEPVTDEQYRG